VGDLYFDDITDEMAYPSPSILKDLRAIIAAGIREGQMIDYKSEISPKDNWPETVAAFANSLGGLIIFGIEGKGDQPRNLCGFDPKGVEVKTQLTQYGHVPHPAASELSDSSPDVGHRPIEGGRNSARF